MSLTIPNLLSLARMGIIPLFVIATLEGRSLQALILFVVAGITDALDGFIARSYGQQSALGRYLDPMADKLLLVASFVLLAIPGVHPGVVIPLWITVLVLARDIIIVVGALVLYLALGITKFVPTMISRINTVAQVAAVILVLFSGLGNHPLFGGLASLLRGPTETSLLAVAALTVISGLDYIFQANRMAGGATPPATE